MGLDPIASQEQQRFIPHLGKVGGSGINHRDLGKSMFDHGKDTHANSVIPQFLVLIPHRILRFATAHHGLSNCLNASGVT